MRSLGEAKTRSRRTSDILADEPRCIYCDQKPSTVEHMPPRMMFRGKQRPSGMEFASCEACNPGTSNADLTASLFARLHVETDASTWQMEEAQRLKRTLKIKAPEVLEELFNPRKTRTGPVRWNGVFRPLTTVTADGPILGRYMRAFASK